MIIINLTKIVNSSNIVAHVVILPNNTDIFLVILHILQVLQTSNTHEKAGFKKSYLLLLFQQVRVGQSETPRPKQIQIGRIYFH